VEIRVRKIHYISRAATWLPITFKDVSRSEAKIENVELFRQLLWSKDFWQIITPNIITSSSEGGKDVFKFEYNKQPSCLAQSPQLHNQMEIYGDFKLAFVYRLKTLRLPFEEGVQMLERAKVMEIEESKDLSSLALDELIDDLKVHEVVMKKDSEIYIGKKERVKSISLKAKKESSDDENSTSESDDEEYAMAVRNFKKFFRRKGKFFRQPREEKKSFRQRYKKKGKMIRNALVIVIQIISLAIVQNQLATKIKRPSLEVLRAIAKMTPRIKLTMKLVSWLNRQMR
nr:aspartate--tRNA ligase 2, cytoplasmic-like [Tanacetum cinerariifolium]